MIEPCLASHTQHGRVKVRTPEEQAEAKRRENEAKVKAYREIIGKIFAKVVSDSWLVR